MFLSLLTIGMSQGLGCGDSSPSDSPQDVSSQDAGNVDAPLFDAGASDSGADDTDSSCQALDQQACSEDSGCASVLMSALDSPTTGVCYTPAEFIGCWGFSEAQPSARLAGFVVDPEGTCWLMRSQDSMGTHPPQWDLLDELLTSSQARCPIIAESPPPHEVPACD